MYYEISSTVDLYEVEFTHEIDEDEANEIARLYVEDFVEDATSDIYEMLGVENLPAPPQGDWRTNWFEQWLIEAFENRKIPEEQKAEIAHEFISRWAYENGFERPEKNWDDADWVADWATQFMGEPKKCCSNCEYLAGECGKTCLYWSFVAAPDEAERDGVQGDLYTDFRPADPDNSVCHCYSQFEK